MNPSPTIAYEHVDPCLNTTLFKEICKLGTGGISIGNTLSSFIFLFFAIAIIIAVIFLIYGGIKWIMSRGEKTEVEAARNQIVAAVVGLIIVFLAFFLINFVLGFFIQNFSISNIQLPSLTTTTPTPVGQ